MTYKPFTLIEYAEYQRTLGNEWADQIYEAAVALEVVDAGETLDDQIRTSLEVTGCVEDESYETIKAVEFVCNQNEQIAAFLEQQDDKWWHAGRDKFDIQARIADGVAGLEQIRTRYEAVQDAFRDLGIIHGYDDDTDLSMLVRMLIAPQT